MGNREHLELLTQGAEVWNVWREKNPGVIPDLEEADLGRASLAGVDLREANLHRAHLLVAKLLRANFQGANLVDSENAPEGFLEWCKKNGALL